MWRRLKLSDVRLLNVDVFWFLSSSGKEINWDIWRRNTDPHFQHSITFYWPTADRLTEEIIKILMSMTTTISRSCASQSSHVIGQADVPRLKITFNTFLKERWSPLVEWWRPAGCSGMWFPSQAAAKPTEGQNQDEHHVFLSCPLMTEDEMFTFSMPYIIKSLRASG